MYGTYTNCGIMRAFRYFLMVVMVREPDGKMQSAKKMFILELPIFG